MSSQQQQNSNPTPLTSSKGSNRQQQQQQQQQHSHYPGPSNSKGLNQSKSPQNNGTPNRNNPSNNYASQEQSGRPNPPRSQQPPEYNNNFNNTNPNRPPPPYRDEQNRQQQYQQQLPFSQNPINAKLIPNNGVYTQSSQKKGISHILIYILTAMVFAYGVVFVVMTSIMIGKYPTYTTKQIQLSQLVSNWQTELIEEFAVVEISSSDIANKVATRCPSGFSNFLTFEGESLISGCDCRTTSSTSYRKSILLGECTSGMVESGCKGIDEINRPQSFQWITGDTLTTFGLCVKKISGLTYASSQSVQTSNSCPEKSCGGSNDQSRFCVSNSQPCPVNHISIGTTGDSSLSDLKSIAIGSNGLQLFTSTMGTSRGPLVEMRITKGKGVCLHDNSNHNLNSNSPTHPLLNTDVVYLCDTIDARFRKIDASPSLDLVEDKALQTNYLTSKYTNIPDFQISNSDMYSVYTRSVVLLERDRRLNDGINAITTLQDSYSNVKKACISVLVTQSVYLVIVGIACAIYTIRDNYIKSKRWDLQVGSDLPNTTSNDIKVIIVKVVASVIHLVSVIVGFCVVLRYWSKLLDINNDRAVGDSETTALMSELRTQYNDNILWYIVVNFIVLIPLLCFEAFIIFGIWKEYRKNKEGSDQGEVNQQQQDTNNKKNSKKSKKNNYQTGGNMDMSMVSEYQMSNIMYGGPNDSEGNYYPDRKRNQPNDPYNNQYDRDGYSNNNMRGNGYQNNYSNGGQMMRSNQQHPFNRQMMNQPTLSQQLQNRGDKGQRNRQPQENSDYDSYSQQYQSNDRQYRSKNQMRDQRYTNEDDSYDEHQQQNHNYQNNNYQDNYQHHNNRDGGGSGNQQQFKRSNSRPPQSQTQQQQQQKPRNQQESQDMVERNKPQDTSEQFDFQTLDVIDIDNSRENIDASGYGSAANQNGDVLSFSLGQNANQNRKGDQDGQQGNSQQRKQMPQNKNNQ